MFLLLQVLLNCGLAAVSNASRKFENVAADNKKLKPFCMQFKKDEAKEARNPKSEPVILGLGLRISFGIRNSEFELWPEACTTQSSEEPSATVL